MMAPSPIAARAGATTDANTASDNKDGNVRTGARTDTLNDTDPDDIEDLFEEDLQSYGGYTKDALLFCIEVSEAMLEPHANLLSNDNQDKNFSEASSNISQSSSSQLKQSALFQILECVYKIILQRIISTPYDKVGVLLYGTRESRSAVENAQPHIFELIPLDLPDAKGVKELRLLLSDPDRFKKIIGSSTEHISIANLFFNASTILTTNAANFVSKRVFLVTSNDNPAGDDQSARKQALTRGKDLLDLGIRIEPLFISINESFQVDKFYEELFFNVDNDGTDFSRIDLRRGHKVLQEMVAKVRSKQIHKHACFELSLELASDFKVGVKGYLLFRKQHLAKSHYVYTRSEKAELVMRENADDSRTSETRDTKKPNESQVLSYRADFNGENIYFSQKEIENLRDFGDPTIRILGFEAVNKLKFWENMRPSWFIYPTEKKVIGSTRLFAALQERMLSSSLIGIASFVRRRQASPLIVAMIPSPLAEDEQTSEQISHPGIYLVQLPFAEDIRQNPPVTHEVQAPEELIIAMGDIIRKLTVPNFDPRKYSNPSLQWQYQVLQALALEEDVPVRAEDNTIPDYDWIKEQSENEIEYWTEILSSYEIKRDTKLEESPSKRIKEASSPGLVETARMRKARKSSLLQSPQSSPSKKRRLS